MQTLRVFLFAAGLTCLAQTSIQVAEKPVSLLQALQSTLENHPNIQIQQQQVEFNRGALRIAAGQFDRTWVGNVSQGYTNTPLTQIQQLQAEQAGVLASFQGIDSSGYGAGVQQQLRNGIIIGPVAQVNRLLDNLQDLNGVSTSNVAFQVTTPFLRGKGREVVTAHERAAQFTVDASVYDVNQTVAQQLATTAGQYWNVVAAMRDLDIAKSAEKRGQDYASEVRTLIDADRVARGEINNVNANLAQRTSNRVAAEERLLQTQQALALAMGTRLMEITAFPMTTDPLPDWIAANVPSITPELVQSFIDRAVDRRADMLAATERQRGAEVLLPAARNQLKPQLDATFSLGYSGLLEGKDYFRIFGSPFYGVGGPTATVGLKYSFAPKNNIAYGAVAEAQASIRQAELQKADVSRNIASSVVTAMISVTDAVARLRKARDAVQSYQLALDGENEKFRLGVNSIVELLTVEDRLTTALSTENAAQLDYATAVVNLRYATGTLIDPRTNTHSIDKDVFTKPPFEWGAP